MKMPLCFGDSTDEIEHKLRGVVAETSALSLSREITFCKQILTVNLKELLFSAVGSVKKW